MAPGGVTVYVVFRAARIQQSDSVIGAAVGWSHRCPKAINKAVSAHEHENVCSSRGLIVLLVWLTVVCPRPHHRLQESFDPNATLADVVGESGSGIFFSGYGGWVPL
jgi:hypothetical protein